MQQQDDDDAKEDALVFGATCWRNVYLRGPASLPKRHIVCDRRPLIRPDGKRFVALDVVAPFLYYMFEFIINGIGFKNYQNRIYGS
jgi:hypothetical protein